MQHYQLLTKYFSLMISSFIYVNNNKTKVFKSASPPPPRVKIICILPRTLANFFEHKTATVHVLNKSLKKE